MLSTKRGIERCIFECPGPGLVNNKIRKSRHLQRSTPSVADSVRTRNPRSDYPFTQFASTILIVDNCSRQNRSAVKSHGDRRAVGAEVAPEKVLQIWAEWGFSGLFCYKTECNNNLLYHLLSPS